MCWSAGLSEHAPAEPAYHHVSICLLLLVSLSVPCHVVLEGAKNINGSFKPVLTLCEVEEGYNVCNSI